jgi:hypothetical protein
MADHPNAMVAEVAQRATELTRCNKVIYEITKWIEKYGTRLHPDDIDYLAELALALAEHARGLTDTLQKAQGSK